MAGPRICRTPDEAFLAGWNEPCDHGSPDPGDCTVCGLTDAEITRLVALLAGLAKPAAPLSMAA